MADRSSGPRMPAPLAQTNVSGERASRLRVCFVGTARLSMPLDATAEKKFLALSEVADVSVIAFSTDRRPRVYRQHATFRLLPNLRPAPLRYAFALVASAILAVYETLHGATVLVAQGPHEGFGAALAKPLARLFGRRVRLVLESHGDYDAALSLQGKLRFPRMTRAILHRMARFSGGQADALRAVSRFTAEQIRTLAPTKPIVVFPAWTDLETFLRAGSTDVPRQPTILYAGVLIPGRGIHHLIRSVAAIANELPAVRLDIIGSMPNERYANELRAEVRNLGLSERVTFLPRMSQASLAGRIAAAGVFAFPTHSEGLGRVVLEAMAAGTPVVASRVGGIPELIVDRWNGYLVEPGDDRSLSAALREVLTNPEEARQAAERGRRTATEVFSVEKYVDGYFSAFQLATTRPQAK